MMLGQLRRSNAMTVVEIVKQKDGVGKSTMGWSLAETGTVLLLDAAPGAVPVTGTTSTSLAPRVFLCKAI